MVNFDPKTTADAKENVVILTQILDMVRRQIRDARDERVRGVSVARFAELEGTRTRIVETWDLRDFAGRAAGSY